ncbi:15419_t:CDS:2, partial [Funneliformis mosseae]
LNDKDRKKSRNTNRNDDSFDNFERCVNKPETSNKEACTREMMELQSKNYSKI